MPYVLVSEPAIFVCQEAEMEMVVCFCALLAITFFVHPVQASKRWKKEEFPNPVKDVASCGREGVVSWICDPEGVLSYERANKVEEMLTSVSRNTASGCSNDDTPGYQIGIAVLNEIEHVPGEQRAKTVENFAKHLQDRWGVGHVCGDGVVFVAAILDRRVHISTGPATKIVLTDEQIDVIIHELKWDLQHERYDDAVELAVQRMGEVLSGKVLSSIDYPTIIILTLFVGAFIVISALVLTAAFRQQSNYENCEEKLRRIERERNAAKIRKSYEAASCPICLEDFTPELKYHILVCGHKYCDPCLRKWLENNSTCPICRKPTSSGQEKSKPTPLDFMPELNFRLMSLHCQHPTYVTREMVGRWTDGSYHGSFRADPLFLQVSRQGLIGRIGSGRGFGGGGSAGGGGSGGSW